MLRFIGNFLIPWATIAVSLFLTIILVWLGLAVLMASSRRTVGTWLAGLGLLAGGTVFAVHTVMLDYTIEFLLGGISLWWTAGWLALLALPGGWYAITLWYAGFWANRSGELRRRQSLGALFSSVLGQVLFGCVIFSNPKKLLVDFASLNADILERNLIMLVLLVGYAVYLPGCVALALDALRRPDPSGHLMRDLARRRARPWLIASTWLQLGISALLIGSLGWVVATAVRNPSLGTYNQLLTVFDTISLLTLIFISVAVALVGKAIVSYEIFSEKTLPRSTFARQWRIITAIAAIFSAAISLALGEEFRHGYVVLGAALAMTVGLSILSARLNRERELSLAALRPFVAAGGWYEQILSPPRNGSADSVHADLKHAGAPPDSTRQAFEALCAILGATHAELHAVGPLATLAGPPLLFPREAKPIVFDSKVLQTTVGELCVPIEAGNGHEGETYWAVPLRNLRETIGVLLLGEKDAGRLYTEEEMEIARAAGERLLDARAGATLAARLMVLQRQRMAESAVLDRRARRVLHDEVLPRLHAALLSLPPEQAGPAEQLASAHREISDLLRDMPSGAAGDIARLGLFESLRRTLESDYENSFDGVVWEVNEVAQTAASRLSSLQSETLFHAVREAFRNAARYGRGKSGSEGDASGNPLHLQVEANVADSGAGEELRIVISDDGAGISSAAPSQGSGQGLVLHGTMMAVIGGTLQAESIASGGTRVVLAVPLEMMPFEPDALESAP
jgi:two-component sensor histidine kinase